MEDQKDSNQTGLLEFKIEQYEEEIKETQKKNREYLSIIQNLKKILNETDSVKEEKNYPSEHKSNMPEIVLLQHEIKSMKTQIYKIQNDINNINTRLGLNTDNFSKPTASQNIPNAPINRSIRSVKITPCYDQNKIDGGEFDKTEDKITDSKQKEESSSFSLFKWKG